MGRCDTDGSSEAVRVQWQQLGFHIGTVRRNCRKNNKSRRSDAISIARNDIERENRKVCAAMDQIEGRREIMEELAN